MDVDIANVTLKHLLLIRFYGDPRVRGPSAMTAKISPGRVPTNRSRRTTVYAPGSRTR